MGLTGNWFWDQSHYAVHATLELYVILSLSFLSLQFEMITSMNPMPGWLHAALGAEKENCTCMWPEGRRVKNTGYSGAVKAVQLPSVHLTKVWHWLSYAHVWPALSTAQGSKKTLRATKQRATPCSWTSQPERQEPKKKKKNFNINKLPVLNILL